MIAFPVSRPMELWEPSAVILAEQSSYYREYLVAFRQKREIVGVGQSDTANNTLCRNCFQGTFVFGQKAPGAPVLAIAL